jgi:type II restriction/modification system DNA methylase subunit YeeA
LNRLRAFRVLDPACGSGNFLYLALLALKDIEHRVSIEAEAIGLQREFSQVGPASVKGIEINPYAAELARVSVWIGEIQWMRRNGFGVSDRPVLKPLNNIECRDAILNADGTEARWPKADVVIGNPPFLGAKEMKGAFPDDYLSALRTAYEGKVAGQSDLVMYWFYRAGQILKLGSSMAVGLVATNKIRKGANHKLLSSICENARVANAWSDLPWIVEGAAVRVSVVCLDKSNYMGSTIYLDGKAEQFIRTELVKSDAKNALTIEVLAENKGVAFVGGQKDGPFDIPRDIAASMLSAPSNPNGRSNADVVRPWCNGMDLARRSAETWIIDFGERTLREAQLYEAPFAHVEKYVAPLRVHNNDKHRRTFWWQHGRPASRAKAALGDRSCMIVTPLTSKHRWFVIAPSIRFPDNSVVVVTRDDLTIFGIVSSSYHAAWAERRGNFMGVGNDPRYTPSTTFDTFPFPEGIAPNLPTATFANEKRAVDIATAANHFNNLRENWLNPSELVRRDRELISALPDRIVPVDDKAARILKQRTLTNLYNEQPAWLKAAQREIDAAVAVAYGWPSDISEEDALAKLFALNQARASHFQSA